MKVNTKIKSIVYKLNDDLMHEFTYVVYWFMIFNYWRRCLCKHLSQFVSIYVKLYILSKYLYDSSNYPNYFKFFRIIRKIST